MANARPTHSIESCAVLAYLRGEPGGEEIARLVSDGENRVALHKLVLLQLYVDFEEADGLELAEQAWSDAAAVFPLDDQLDDAFLKRVARWRRELGGPGSLAVAASLAEEHQAALVAHADEPRLDVLERSGLDVVVVGSAARAEVSTETDLAAPREASTEAATETKDTSDQGSGHPETPTPSPTSALDVT